MSWCKEKQINIINAGASLICFDWQLLLQQLLDKAWIYILCCQFHRGFFWCLSIWHVRMLYLIWTHGHNLFSPRFSHKPALWSPFLAAGGRGTRLRNTAPPGVEVNAGHCGRTLEALHRDVKKGKSETTCASHETSHTSHRTLLPVLMSLEST